MYHCCVYSDKLLRSCPKHVQFYSKNKFEKLVHLVGFIIRIYCDARLPERQIIALCNDVGVFGQCVNVAVKCILEIQLICQRDFVLNLCNLVRAWY